VATRQSAARITFARAVLGAGFLLVAAQSAAHLFVTVGHPAAFGASGSTFDLGASNGVPDVASTLVIAAAALGACVLAIHDRVGRLAAALLAATLFALGADDAFHTGEAGAYGLVVIATVLAAGAFAVSVALRTSRPARTSLLVGLTLLALDVKMPFAYDQLMNLVGQPALSRGDVLYELGVVLDEGTELMGWVLVALALWGAALAARLRPTTGARAQVAARAPSARSR
jgi:hypothetical protein